MKNKLLLINLYSSGTIAGYLLSSYVLKAYLSKTFDSRSELRVDILNYNVATEAGEICKDIIKAKPRYIGYSCYTWNIEKVLRVIEELRKSSDFVHILGGPEISLKRISSFPRQARADYYVIGEGENTLTNLLLYLERPPEASKKEALGGVAYFERGTIVFKEKTDRIMDLDEIPSVYLTGTLDESLYGRRQAFLETQRGCRFKCKYCVYHKNLPALSFYSLSRIYDELDYLIIDKQVMALRIFDSVFTSDLTRAKKIAQHLLKLKGEGIRLPWVYWEFTCETVDDEFIGLISALKDGERILNTEQYSALDRPQLYSDLLKGYTAINGVGVQSFCAPALKAVGRPRITPEKLKSFMDMSKKHNIVLKIDLIIGLPMETFDSYFEGLEGFLPFFEKTDHILNIHRLQILSCSELETLCESYGINYSTVAPRYVLSTPDFPEDKLNYASKLSAILFRVLNSPLRGIFFAAKKRAGKSFYELIENIMNAIISAKKFKSTIFVKNDFINDEYWNQEIFEEIPSAWLTELLKSIPQDSNTMSLK